MKLFSALLILLLIASPTLGSDTDDLVGFGNSFYENCASVESYNSTNSDHVNDLKATFCLGFMEGLEMGVMAADISRSDKTFCGSKDVTNAQLVRIVRKYIADHPETAHQPTAILAVNALRVAFPCK